MTNLKIGKYQVEITNPDKVLFPKDNITKEQLCDYYLKIGPIMVPHMKNRAITMHRYPQGINETGFYHKDAPDFFPEWIKTFPVKNKDNSKVVHYIVVNNVATLVYIANFGCITPHLWLSKIDKADFPDRLIFDLDPPDEKHFKLICKVAKNIKQVVEGHGLVPFVKTTGSRGLHVEVPIKRKYDFDTVKKFANQIAQIVIKADPKNTTMEIRKDKRGERIFIDTLRNAFGATAVSPYAVRAKNGAPIATPLHWHELDDPKLGPQSYNISNIFKRIDKTGDIWKDIDQYSKSIKKEYL